TVKMDMDEIETLNIELEHRVTKLVAENEHLKQTYKQLYDSIKPKRVQSKEQCDALIKQVNIKSGEISNLNAKLQEQGLVIAALKNELRKLKGKAVDKEAIETHSVDPNVLKDNMEPITPLRITTTNEVPSRKPIVLDSESPKLVVKFLGSIRILSPLAKLRLSKSSSVKFGNDQVAKIMGFGDYQIGNVTISRIYYVEGLGHNIFSVGQFCDSNLEVAFRQHTCLYYSDLTVGGWIQGSGLGSLSNRFFFVGSTIQGPGRRRTAPEESSGPARPNYASTYTVNIN
ncbi:hypothetical protein Tco_1178849, partial [Tanacetum coccineum]